MNRVVSRASAIMLFALLLNSCGEPTVNAPATYDLILRGGTLVDGSGTAAYVGDLAINGEHIVAIGDLGSSAGIEEIDVSGLIVAPGFINIHSHASKAGMATAINMLSQGVTTEIINADGYGDGLLTEQLTDFASEGLALNLGGMVGFNAVWRDVVGMDEVRPTADQIDEMQSLILDNLQAGAWGVSAGLDYVPGYYATTDEVVEVLTPFADWHVVFANHDRVTPESGFSSIAGMSETIAIGEASGLIPLITHMKVQGWEQGQADTILTRMREADTAFTGGAVADVYPYLAGLTGLESLIIPSWAQAGGRDEMLARFAQEDLRAQIRQEAETAMGLRFGGPDGVFLLGSQRELSGVMVELGEESAAETVMRVLEESPEGIIARFGSEADLVDIMQHPTASIACDCGAQAPDVAFTHPRNWGSFPKVLGEFVREKKDLTLEDAIYKMTGLPAKTIGMTDRGLLKPGLVADITVFDADTVIDHATYSEPTLQSEGIIHTLLNGEFGWRDGSATGLQAGQILTRPIPAF